MKRTKASIRPIYAQLWKCSLCDKKLFSFEAIPTVHSPKQDCLCAKCFVEDNPELAKKIAKIVSKKDSRSEEADDFLLTMEATMISGGYFALWAILGIITYFIYAFFIGEPATSETGMTFAICSMVVGVVIYFVYTRICKKSLF